MNVEEVQERLEELEERYQEWAAPISRITRECWRKLNRDGYTAADFDRDVKRARDEQLAQYEPFKDMSEFFDRLCPAYLDATPQERAEIRAAVRDKSGVAGALLGYVYRSASRLKSPSDREWLRLGLAAVSIEDCCRDYRDVLLALAELYVAAEEAGLRPQPEFTAVAKLSSSEKPTGGNTPVRRMLSGFHRYGALEERKRKGKSALAPNEERSKKR
jgi:hypothetical protein